MSFEQNESKYKREDVSQMGDVLFFTITKNVKIFFMCGRKRFKFEAEKL